MLETNINDVSIVYAAMAQLLMGLCDVRLAV